MRMKIVKASDLGNDWRAETHVYYPEMGGEPDRSKLFQRARHVGRFTFVDWASERDAEARAVFKRFGVRPYIENRGNKYTARLTGAAWHKVQAEGDVSIEALL